MSLHIMSATACSDTPATALESAALPVALFGSKAKEGILRPTDTMLPVRTRPAIPMGAVVILCLLAFAGVATAAFHTSGGIHHGIGSTTGGGVGSGQPYARSGEDFDLDTWYYFAGMYHLREDGGLNQQCYVGGAPYYAKCDGNWGVEPCKKRAYTRGWVSGYGDVSPWHWMRGSSCPGSTHQ